jgi:hypothetical protein
MAIKIIRSITEELGKTVLCLAAGAAIGIYTTRTQLEKKIDAQYAAQYEEKLLSTYANLEALLGDIYDARTIQKHR